MLNRLKKGFEERRDQNRKASASAEGHESQGFLCPECLQMLETPEGLQKHFEAEHSQPPAYSSGNISPDSGNSCENLSYPPATQPAVPKTHVEGHFVCPQCLVELSGAEELQSHFAALHEGSASFYNADFTALRHELNDIRASLKEEKWYSNELKKELHQLGAKISDKQQIPAGEDELVYCQQLIQVLEAGKALVTSQMLAGEKETAELRRNCESLRREKDRITQKTLAMSREHAGMKSQWDEQMGEKMALGEELLKLKAKLKTLMSQLDQRPSEDDVTVLRTELVRSQTLLDEMRQATEAELVDLKQRCAELTDKNQTLEILLESLTNAEKINVEQAEKQNSSVDELETMKAELSAKSERLDEAEMELIELREKLELCQDEVAEIAFSVDTEKLSAVAQQTELDKKVLEVADLTTKLQTERMLKADLESRVEAEVKLMKTDLDSKLQAQREVKKKLTQEVTQLKSQLAQLSTESDAKSENESKLKLELTSSQEEKVKLAAELDQFKGQLAQLTAEFDAKTTDQANLRAELNGLQLKLESSERSDAAKLERIAECQADLQVQIGLVKQLEADRVEMYQKIEDGEGISAGFTQLLAEKESLHGQLKEKDEKMSLMKLEFEQKLNVPYQLLQEVKESLNLAKEDNVSLTRNAEHLESQIKLLNDENANAAAKLASAEKNLTDARVEVDQLKRKLEQSDSRLKSLDEEKTMMTGKLAAAGETLSAAREENAQLKEKLQQSASQLKSLGVEYDRLTQTLTESQKTFATSQLEAETKFAEFSGEIAQLQLTLKESRDRCDQLERELTAQSSVNSRLTEQLQKSSTEAEALSENLTRLQTNLAEKIEELKSQSDLASSRLSQIERLTQEQSNLNEKLQEFQSKLEIQTSENLHLVESEKLLQIQLENGKSELSRLTNENSHLQDKLTAEQQLVKQQAEEIVVQSAELDEQKRVGADLNAQLTGLSEKLQLALATGVTLSSQVDNLTTKLSDKEQQVVQLELDRNSLKVQLDETSTHLQHSQSEVNSLHGELKELRGNFISATEEISALQGEKSTLIADLTAKTAQLDSLVESLSQLRLDLQNGKELLSQNEAERKSLNDQIQQNQLRIKDLEDQLTTAQNQLKDLEGQIVSLNDEKRSLLERYVELEEQMEFERARVVEVRRAYDGAVSAMHELGRENQSLQIDTAKKLDRRWMSDAEALNCANCGVKFSLTVRKHHCRSCGLIYCAGCTGKSAVVGATSNRPSRVCDSCHTEFAAR